MLMVMSMDMGWDGDRQTVHCSSAVRIVLDMTSVFNLVMAMMSPVAYAG